MKHFPVTVLLDPGHGLYRTKTGVFSYQREEVHGVLEDLLTVELAVVLASKLRTHVRTVLSTRYFPGEGGPDTVSSADPWHEGAWAKVGREVPGFKGNSREKDLRARTVYAANVGADLLISIHSNASGHGKARGFEVWASPGTTERELSGKFLAQDIDGALRKGGFTSRGVKGPFASKGSWEYDWAKNLSVLKSAPCPSALVECFFYDNRDDAALLRDPVAIEKMAESITAGVVQYLSRNSARDGENE